MARLDLTPTQHAHLTGNTGNGWRHLPERVLAHPEHLGHITDDNGNTIGYAAAHPNLTLDDIEHMLEIVDSKPARDELAAEAANGNWATARANIRARVEAKPANRRMPRPNTDDQ